VRERDRLRDELAEAGIGSAVYYPRTLAEQKCFASLNPDPDAVPVARDLCQQVLSIPIYPGLPRDHQDAVIEAVVRFAAE
jgi:dTDP-4-amino-4,6-dideoxygalactose transaminase